MLRRVSDAVATVSSRPAGRISTTPLDEVQVLASTPCTVAVVSTAPQWPVAADEVSMVSQAVVVVSHAGVAADVVTGAVQVVATGWAWPTETMGNACPLNTVAAGVLPLATPVRTTVSGCEIPCSRSSIQREPVGTSMERSNGIRRSAGDGWGVAGVVGASSGSAETALAVYPIATVVTTSAMRIGRTRSIAIAVRTSSTRSGRTRSISIENRCPWLLTISGMGRTVSTPWALPTAESIKAAVNNADRVCWKFIRALQICSGPTLVRVPRGTP